MSMSKQETAALSVKILSLYIVINALVATSLETLPYVQQQFFAASKGANTQLDFGSIPNMYARELISFLIPLLIALLLWKSANWLGTRMVMDKKEHLKKQSLTAIEIQTLIISVIGLFVTINSLPQFILFFTALSLPAIPGSNFSSIFLQLLTPLLSVLMGWFLLFNAAKISHYLHKER
jgi:hypothetical protein